MFSAVVEATSQAEHTNQAVLEAMHPPPETNTSRLSPLKPYRILETPTANLSPESKSLVEAIENKIKQAPAAKQRLLFSGLKEVFIRNKETLPQPKVARTGPSLDMNAFYFFAPDTPGIPKSWWGKSREKYSASLATKSNVPALESAGRARRRAVLRIVDAAHAAGGEDQRALALYHALNHHKLRDYVGRIYRSFISESVQVGLHALNGMQELVRVITEGASGQGRSQNFRAFLQTIAMCLTKGAGEHGSVSHRPIFRNVFGSLGRWSTRRLIEKGGKKRKRMEEESLQDFKLVEEEAERCKYTEEDIIGMRKYLCSHKHTRASPNAKDSIDERDMYGRWFCLEYMSNFNRYVFLTSFLLLQAGKYPLAFYPVPVKRFIKLNRRF